ncbi:MAG: GMC oxidoreductase [Acidimicrobiales bacterium]
MAGPFDYDVLVIGSGFGGSVTALRLTEKGYRLGVLEAGRRFDADDFPKTNWNLRRFLWAPGLGLRGIQRITLLKDVLILSGCGVGGGSLVYANTLYEPLDPFYRDPQWGHITDWKAELSPFYERAKRVLGVNDVPFDTPADVRMRAVAERLGVADTYHPTPVGVFFGEPGVTVPDPYFGGAGPERTGCTRCGGCMVGCRFGAKNTLDRNYLYLAERGGAVVHPETKAVGLRPLPGGGYEVTTQRPGAWLRRRKRTFTAEHVVLSAAVLGTLRLLMQMKDDGHLPNLSDQLGRMVRTNSEAIVGAGARRIDRDFDYTDGVAITSSIHPDDHTHIEPVRYPKGSNAMGMLATTLVDGGGRIPRQLRFGGQIIRHPAAFLRSLSVRRWSEKGIILLVMQTLDNSISIVRRRRRLTTGPGHGEPNPTYIPVANQAARILADEIQGDAFGSWFEALLNVPTTAHILGGCCIGDSPATGVIDPYQRVHGHPGLHVADGSAISANLGVNPSLTIATMTERAMAMWPNKGETDPRPPLGEPYRRVDAVMPGRPAVPDGAPAALVAS